MSNEFDTFVKRDRATKEDTHIPTFEDEMSSFRMDSGVSDPSDVETDRTFDYRPENIFNDIDASQEWYLETGIGQYARPVKENMISGAKLGYRAGKGVLSFGMNTAAWLMSPLTRANKYVAGYTQKETEFFSKVFRDWTAVYQIGRSDFSPEEKAQRLEQVELWRDAPQSIGDAANDVYDLMKDAVVQKWRTGRALIPWPGIADDMDTIGEMMSKSYYETLNEGQPAPWWYAPTVDISSDILAMKMVGVIGKAKKLKATVDNARLRPEEMAMAKMYYSKRAIANMQPSDVRGMLMKEMTKESIAQQLNSSGTPQNAGKALDKFLTALKATKPVRETTDKMYHEELSRRVSNAVKEAGKYRGEKWAKVFAKQLAGDMPTADFMPVRGDLGPNELRSIFDMINNHKRFTPLERFRAHGGLKKVLDAGKVPQRSELALLEEVFGKDVVSQIARHLPKHSQHWDKFLDVLNFPRTVTAAYDFSAALKQGAMALPGHPMEWSKSLVSMYKAAIPGQKGKAHARYIDEMMRHNPNFQTMKHHGLYIAPIDDISSKWTKLSAREEMFASRAAEALLPGIQWSRRTYTTFLNQLRYNIADDIMRQWQGTGKTVKDYKDLMKYINHLSGRGDLGKMEGLGSIANAAFFSPRFNMSRIQVNFVDPFTSTPDVTKIIASDLVKFYGTGVLLLKLAEMNGAEVETNVRSADFGKIKVGNTRIDIWGGNQQMAVLIGRLATGERMSADTRLVSDANAYEVVERYLRSKLSPGASLAIDVLRGETMMGDEMTLETSNISAQAVNRLTPMFIRSAVEIIKHQQDPANIPWQAALSMHGATASTWEPAPFASYYLAAQDYSREIFGKEVDELTPSQANLLDAYIGAYRDDIDAFRREAKFDSRTPHLQGIQRKIAQSKKDMWGKLPKEVKGLLEEHTVDIGGLSPVIGNWRMNDDVYKKYQEYAADAIQEFIQRTAKMSSFRSMNKAAKEALLDQTVQGAKEFASERIQAEIETQGRDKTGVTIE